MYIYKFLLDLLVCVVASCLDASPQLYWEIISLAPAISIHTCIPKNMGTILGHHWGRGNICSGQELFTRVFWDTVWNTNTENRRFVHFYLNLFTFCFPLCCLFSHIILHSPTRNRDKYGSNRRLSVKCRGKLCDWLPYSQPSKYTEQTVLFNPIVPPSNKNKVWLKILNIPFFFVFLL